jgi:diacylglycerol kinase family enzyme
VRVRFDDGETIDVRTALIVAANGRYFGSGMMIAPDASIDDGHLDALVYRAEGKLRMILDFNNRGAPISLPRVKLKRCRWFEVEPAGKRDDAIIEVDGESPGRVPARFEVLPGALTLRA